MTEYSSVYAQDLIKSRFREVPPVDKRGDMMLFKITPPNRSIMYHYILLDVYTGHDIAYIVGSMAAKHAMNYLDENGLTNSNLQYLLSAGYLESYHVQLDYAEEEDTV